MADEPTNHLTIDQVVDGSDWINDHFNVGHNGDGSEATCRCCYTSFDGHTTIEQLGKHLDFCEECKWKETYHA